MINVIICDDNDKDRSKEEDIVKEFMNQNNKQFELFSFDDYNKKFFATSNLKMPFKIYLLDIETPSNSGIDVAREIRKKDIDSIIIFLTAHEELGNVILKNDLMFLSFINKFDNFNNRLNDALKKALDMLGHKNIIRINDRNITYTINSKDILYITKDSFERKTIIKTDYNEIKLNKSLFEIVGLLDDRFVQTHRACYINTERKVKIDRTKRIIMFDNGEKIDLLSDKYKKEVC